jgi:cytochrome c oxidase assembly protein subunit 15
VPILLALVHQGVAILVLTLVVVQAERLMAGSTALEAQRLRVAAG